MRRGAASTRRWRKPPSATAIWRKPRRSIARRWPSTSIPAARASQLVGHARVLLKQKKELEDAATDLEEALTSVPDHGPALLLLGNLTYRNQAWEQAREITGGWRRRRARRASSRPSAPSPARGAGRHVRRRGRGRGRVPRGREPEPAAHRGARGSRTESRFTARTGARPRGAWRSCCASTHRTWGT